MEKFVEIIKLIRPKFYNGITWTMVIAGIGMMSNSLWVGIANGLAEKFFKISILDKFSPLYGLGLILLALTFNTVNLLLDQKDRVHAEGSSREQSERQKRAEAHDLDIYRREAEILNQEKVDYFYNHVGAEHSCIDDDYRPLAEFHDFSIRPENRYLNKDIQVSREALAEAANKVSWFLVTHFFHFPNHQINGHWHKALYPELNIDRGGSYEGMAKYDEYADELMQLLKTLHVAFREYRLCIKKEFLI